MTNFVHLPAEKVETARRILADGVIDGAEALRLGQDLFLDGVVDMDEADLMLHLDACATDADNGEAWEKLFVNALTDFFVWKQFPPGALSQQSADYLVRRVTADGKINSKTEFALLRNIAKTAKRYPRNVALLILRAVKESALKAKGRESGEGSLFGPGRRRAGVIDAVGAAVIRDVIYAPGGGFTVSRQEAELLFELNDATLGKNNAPEWRDLFAKGVGNYLIYPYEEPKSLSVEAIAKRQEWLTARTQGAGNFIQTMGRSLAGGSAFNAALDTAAEYLPGGVTNEEKDLVAKLDAEAAIADRLSQVDEAEAAWLLERVNADGEINENERAMLAFIKENALRIHPSLDPLYKAAGL